MKLSHTQRVDIFIVGFLLMCLVAFFTFVMYVLPLLWNHPHLSLTVGAFIGVSLMWLSQMGAEQ